MERFERFLRLQYCLGRLAAVVTTPLVFLAVRLMGWRIRDVRRIRRDIAGWQRDHRGPWIICANHLTMVDSAVISYGMASLWGHILRFRRVPWNLPERDNFQRNPLLTLMCYLAKCLPVNRGGSREELQQLLAKCCRVLEWKQSLMIFPEGGRSRTGRVNREGFSYGVGRFLSECGRCRVLLVYLRGDGQSEYGAIPRFGERFTMMAEVFDLGEPEGKGLRFQREYARRIVERLAAMEGDYFAARG
ncbi:MAG: 1-acyl-sn-glycerol-3-phosphate acyltransferase [Proteobacteria bacterium]|nr:1-acyl-sn-glycerol-3-phosphate acyltransferase [Pseudomonadota bacterium]MBU2260401.1 1-acyl-sn-glycerol-3-phosphate acyltransferase [Pseudomonadota bacterium]